MLTMLTIGQVQRAWRRIAQAGIARVTDHADDFEIVLFTGQANALPHGRTTTWQLPCECLIDQRNTRRILAVGGGEVAASQQWNPHRVGMPWRDVVDVHAHLVLSWRRTGNRDAVARRTARQEPRPRERDG